MRSGGREVRGINLIAEGYGTKKDGKNFEYGRIDSVQGQKEERIKGVLKEMEERNKKKEKRMV